MVKLVAEGLQPVDDGNEAEEYFIPELKSVDVKDTIFSEVWTITNDDDENLPLGAGLVGFVAFMSKNEAEAAAASRSILFNETWSVVKLYPL